MTSVVRATKHPTLRIVMDRSFAEFNDAEKSAFLNDLSTISGCPTEEIRNVEFRQGCVIFEGDLDEEAIKRIIEDYDKALIDETASEIKEFAAFLRKYSIKRVKYDFPIPLPISIPKRADKHTQEIVLVHGWSGDGNTFGKIPEYLSARFNCPARIYEYPTSWWSHSPALYFVALNFDNWFHNNIEAEKVALIAHSMGGIVARKFLVLENRRPARLDRRVKQVTFVASPHNGSVLANIGDHISELRSAQLRDLSPDSGFPFELNDQWQEWSASMVPASCKVRSIFGTDDKVVSPANARGLDQEAVPILGAGHKNIVKPADSESEIMRTITRFLVEAGFTTTKPPGGVQERSSQPSR